MTEPSSFFFPLQAVDLSALGAQALAQVERARKAAAEQLAAAIRQKPRLDLSLELDAPKIAIPVPATVDGRGELLQRGLVVLLVGAAGCAPGLQ